MSWLKNVGKGIGKAVKGRFEEYKRERAVERDIEREARQAGFKAGLEERKRQIVKTAILEEKMKGAKGMDRAKYGGFVKKVAQEQMKEDSRELLKFRKGVVKNEKLKS